jgi:hypothetical protein
MLLTFHACREETEAIIREGGDFFFYHTFLYCIFNNSSFPSNYSMHASFFLFYVYFFKSQSLLKEKEEARRHKVHPFTLFFSHSIGKG